MYKAFYNLKRNPFEITPDPSFLFPTKRHNEALAALYYGVRRHKGFVVLTGEVGTGKTLLLRCLLQLLKKNNDVAYAYVFNGKLTPVEFLQYVAGDLGLPSSGKNEERTAACSWPSTSSGAASSNSLPCWWWTKRTICPRIFLRKSGC